MHGSKCLLKDHLLLLLDSLVLRLFGCQKTWMCWIFVCWDLENCLRMFILSFECFHPCFAWGFHFLFAAAGKLLLLRSDLHCGCCLYWSFAYYYLPTSSRQLKTMAIQTACAQPKQHQDYPYHLQVTTDSSLNWSNQAHQLHLDAPQHQMDSNYRLRSRPSFHDYFRHSYMQHNCNKAIITSSSENWTYSNWSFWAFLCGLCVLEVAWGSSCCVCFFDWIWDR